MGTVEINPTLTMHYEEYCFTPPWTSPETVLTVHGVAESGRVWFAFMPELARRFRVVVPDVRGFGQSSVPPTGTPWTLEVLAADLVSFLDILGIDSVHLVGAKFGGTIAAHFAAQFPTRVKTLSLLNALIRPERAAMDASTIPKRAQELGFAGFARESQRLRLGTRVSAAQVDWWNEIMASANSTMAKAAAATAAGVDLSDSLPNIQAPTLVVTSDRNPMASLEWVLEWQRRIPRSELLVLPGDGYHVAAFAPEECARNVIAFIDRSGNAVAIDSMVVQPH